METILASTEDELFEEHFPETTIKEQQVPSSPSYELPAAPEPAPTISLSDTEEAPVVKRRRRLRKKTKSSSSPWFISEVTHGHAEKTKVGEDLTLVRAQLQEQLDAYKARMADGNHTGGGDGDDDEGMEPSEKIANLQKEIDELDVMQQELATEAAREEEQVGAVISSDEDEDALDKPTNDDIQWQAKRLVGDDDEKVQRDNRRARKRLRRARREEDDATDAHALRDPSDRRAVLTHAIINNSGGALAKGAARLSRLINSTPPASSTIDDSGGGGDGVCVLLGDFQRDFTNTSTTSARVRSKDH